MSEANLGTLFSGPAGGLLRQEGATEAVALRQVAGDMAKLRGVVLVDEQDIHGG